MMVYCFEFRAIPTLAQRPDPHGDPGVSRRSLHALFTGGGNIEMKHYDVADSLQAHFSGFLECASKEMLYESLHSFVSAERNALVTYK